MLEEAVATRTQAVEKNRRGGRTPNSGKSGGGLAPQRRAIGGDQLLQTVQGLGVAPETDAVSRRQTHTWFLVCQSEANSRSSLAALDPIQRPDGVAPCRHRLAANHFLE